MGLHSVLFCRPSAHGGHVLDQGGGGGGPAHLPQPLTPSLPPSLPPSKQASVTGAENRP